VNATAQKYEKPRRKATPGISQGASTTSLYWCSEWLSGHLILRSRKDFVLVLNMKTPEEKLLRG
jgi:hypothetical protein